MPQWYFFAFNAKRVMNVLLNPVQNAIDNRDLSVWEKSYDLLSKSHYPPTEGGFAWDGSIIENLNRGGSLSRASVPERTSPVLRKCLQTFVELVSPCRLTSHEVVDKNCEYLADRCLTAWTPSVTAMTSIG